METSYYDGSALEIGGLYYTAWDFALFYDDSYRGYPAKAPDRGRPLTRLSRHWSGDGNNQGFEVIATKHKIRGRGRSFALYIASEEGKSLDLLGISVVAGINANG